MHVPSGASPQVDAVSSHGRPTESNTRMSAPLDQRLCLSIAWLASSLHLEAVLSLLTASRESSVFPLLVGTALVMTPELAADQEAVLLEALTAPLGHTKVTEVLSTWTQRYPSLSSLPLSSFAALEAHVTQQGQSLGLEPFTQQGQSLGLEPLTVASLAKAIVRRNSLLVKNLSFTKLLLDNEEYLAWHRGVVAPLAHLNAELVPFEAMAEPDAFAYLMDRVDVSTVDSLCPLVLEPYLTFTSYDHLTQWLLHHTTTTTFPLLRTLVCYFAPRASAAQAASLTNAFLSLAYACPDVSLPIFVYIKETLAVLRDLGLPEGPLVTTPNGDPRTWQAFATTALCQPTQAALRHLSTVLETAEQLHHNRLSFADILHLGASDAGTQTAQLKTLVASNSALLRGHREWLSFVASVYRLQPHIFNAIAKDELDWMMFETLMAHRQYQVLGESANLVGIDPQRRTAAVSARFWQEVDQASNLNTGLSHLADARAVLALTKDAPVACERAMSVFDTLKNFKFHLRKNVPVTPAALLEQLRRDPFVVVAKILELNPKAYLAPEKLKRLSRDMDEVVTAVLPQRDLRVETLCCESALVDDNFKYALKYALALLKNHSAQELRPFWLTFFQVGKYTSPNGAERDGHAIRHQQMWVLSETLLLVPSTQLEIKRVVLGQWEALRARETSDWDLELPAARPERGLEQRLTSALAAGVKELGFEGRSARQTATDTTEKVSSLLVSGLGWAIGAKLTP